MKILWLSRHPAHPRQVQELKKRFGSETEVRQDVNAFKSAEEILRRYREGGYDDLLVVAPLSVIQRLCELGLKPLWAEMEVVPRREDAEIEANGRFYCFVRFRRIIAVEIKFEEI